MDIIYLDKPSYLPASAGAHLGKAGNFKIYDDLPDETQAIDRLNSADVAIVEWTAINSSMIEKLTRLKCIVLVTTGYDFVDVQAAKSKGIVVCNTPQYSRQSVAEHVFALTFEICKDLCEANALVRQRPGKAAYIDHKIGLELYGKTLGIWGLGSIGSWVSQIGTGLGMRVIGSSRTPKNLPNVEQLPIDAVLQQSDVFSVCVTVNTATRGFLNRNRLLGMKKGVILINTTENSILDEQAIADLLNQGHIRGAAFDSTPPEGSPLLSAKNAFFTPGTAWYTQDSLDRNAEMFVDTVMAFIEGHPRFVVNP